MELQILVLTFLIVFEQTSGFPWQQVVHLFILTHMNINRYMWFFYKLAGV